MSHGKRHLYTVTDPQASLQGGSVNRAQLLASGVTPRQISRALSRGDLVLVYHNVYAFGHLPTNPIDRCHAALLAIGERAAMAGRSAGSLWGIQRDWQYPLELVTPLDRRIRGLIIHQSRALLSRDVTVQHDLQVTSPALTILHIAPTLTQKRLERAIDDLRLARYLKLEQLVDVLERFPRHRGAKLLREVLGIAHPEPTRSTWEQDWRYFAEAHGLPSYEMNVHVDGYRVDVLFPERLIVELDGPTHDSPWGRRHDAEQDARTSLPTIRVKPMEMKTDPAAVAAGILANL